MALRWQATPTRRRLPPLGKVVLIPLGIGVVIIAVIAAFGLGAIVLPTLTGNAAPDPERLVNQPPPAPGGVIGGGANGGAIADPTPVDEAAESPEASPSESPTTPPSTGDNQIEAQMIGLINVERSRAGCGPVRVEAQLRDAARAHSLDMASRNFLNHTGSDRSSPTDRMNQAGYGQGSGEVIAKGPADAQTVIRAWLRGQQQRRSVLDCSARAVGVGVAARGRTVYWTADFGTI